MLLAAAAAVETVVAQWGGESYVYRGVCVCVHLLPYVSVYRQTGFTRTDAKTHGDRGPRAIIVVVVVVVVAVVVAAAAAAVVVVYRHPLRPNRSRAEYTPRPFI